MRLASLFVYLMVYQLLCAVCSESDSHLCMLSYTYLESSSSQKIFQNATVVIIYWPIVPLFRMSPKKRHHVPFCFYEDSVALGSLSLFPPQDMNKIALNRCELFSKSSFNSLCALKQSGSNLHEYLYHTLNLYNTPNFYISTT